MDVKWPKVVNWQVSDNGLHDFLECFSKEKSATSVYWKGRILLELNRQVWQ